MQNKITFLIIVLLINTYTKAQTIRYVSPTGLGNGTSWANAAPGSNLQSIINTAAIGDQIWVRCGSYSPTNTANRAISFSLRNGVSLYGGFDGTETVLSDRDISCFSCSILSGEIGAAGIADNSYHVISNPAGLNATALIDGFVIENANDNRTASSTAGLGGGIYNNGGNAGNICSPTIRNCVIRNNAAQFGAGIFNSGFSGGNSSPLIENCIIHNNNAYNGGGAIDNFGLGGNASPTLTNCIVYNNTATSRAGGMYNWGGNGGNASPSIINCTFANNSSTFGGALVSDNENSPGGTFSGNSNPILLNTIFWGNTATTMGSQFYIIGTATLSATYSCIDMSAQATPHILSGSTIGNIYSNPLLNNIADADGTDNCWGSSDDGLIPTSSSPTINAGTLTGAPTTDVRNMLRTGNPEIGAYEACSLNLTVAGSNNLCEGDTATYTETNTHPMGTTYTWVVTNGTIISGGGPTDNFCTIVWSSGTNAGSVALSVTEP